MSEDRIADYAKDFSLQFHLEPASTALIIVDMQYASACRGTGLGKLMKEQGKEALVQERFDRIENVVIPTIQRLLSFFRQNRLPVIHVTLGSETPDFSDVLPHVKALLRSCNNRAGEKEHEILEEVRPQPGELVINKTTIGALNSTNLDAILRSRGIEYLLFTGVSTNMCVETTARDAADRGFLCVLVEDGCGSSTFEYHRAALATFQRLFGKVQTSREVMDELSTALNPSA